MFTLTPARRRLCKPLIRTNYASFARQCVHKNHATRRVILHSLGQLLKNEVKKLCSDKFPSDTRLKRKEYIQNFDLVKRSMLKEMRENAPTLFSILMSALKTRTKWKNTDEIILVLLSIICKHRRNSSCLLQSIVSMVLYTGHSSKQVRMHLFVIHKLEL